MMNWNGPWHGGRRRKCGEKLISADDGLDDGIFRVAMQLSQDGGGER